MDGKYLFKMVSSLNSAGYVPCHRVDMESDKTCVRLRTWKTSDAKQYDRMQEKVR